MEEPTLKIKLEVELNTTTIKLRYNYHTTNTLLTKISVNIAAK